MHADRTNRAALIVLALALIAAGGVGIVAGFGLLDTDYRERTLLDNRVGAFVGDNASWFWWVAAGVSLVVLLLCLRWVWVLLLSTDRVSDLPLGDVDGPGGTTLASRALVAAVADEIADYRGVLNVRSRIIGEQHDPTVVLRVEVAETADVAALRDQIDTLALQHAREALGRDSISARVDFVVGSRRTARVR